MFTVTGYSFGSGSTTSVTMTLIVATGTPLILLPSDVVAAYYKQISGARYNSDMAGYIFPCGATLPSFTAVIGGAQRTVPGSFINFSPASTPGSCYGAIQANDGCAFAIYGNTFLKANLLFLTRVAHGWVCAAEVRLSWIVLTYALSRVMK